VLSGVGVGVVLCCCVGGDELAVGYSGGIYRSTIDSVLGLYKQEVRHVNNNKCKKLYNYDRIYMYSICVYLLLYCKL